MIKDTRYIIKRVIIGVLICLILSFIRTCEVKALSNIQTIELNYDQTIGTAISQVSIYSRTSNYQLVNYGRGLLQFQVAFYKFDSNATTNWNQNLTGIYVRSGNNLYTCNIGTIANESSGNVNYKFNMYSALCDVDLGSTGLNEIVLELNNSTSGYTIKSSNYMTFIGDVTTDLLTHIDTINNTLVTYLQSVYNASLQTATNTGATNNYLSAIQVLLNSDLTQIINLMSNNTQAIIDNQNQNTQEQIESQQVCEIVDKNKIKTSNKYLNSRGVETDSDYFGITGYIKITSNDKIKVKEQINGSAHTCFYNINKTLISCIQNSTMVLNSYLTIPSDASYMRNSINESINKPQFEICKSGNQANNDAINSVNDTLNDSSVDDPNGSLNDMNSKIATNSVISDLLLLPVTLFQNILNSINGTCTTFNLGSLLGTNLTMPCIDIESIIGSALWGVIDILLCGLFILAMRKKFVDIFQNITSLKDGGNQLE